MYVVYVYMRIYLSAFTLICIIQYTIQYFVVCTFNTDSICVIPFSRDSLFANSFPFRPHIFYSTSYSRFSFRASVYATFYLANRRERERNKIVIFEKVLTLIKTILICISSSCDHEYIYNSKYMYVLLIRYTLYVSLTWFNGVHNLCVVKKSIKDVLFFFLLNKT